jgi:hypothetical protein
MVVTLEPVDDNGIFVLTFNRPEKLKFVNLLYETYVL